MHPRPMPRIADGFLLLGLVLVATGLGSTAATTRDVPDLAGSSFLTRGVHRDTAAAIPPDDRSACLCALPRHRPGVRDAPADARLEALASPFRPPANVGRPRVDSDLRGFLLASASAPRGKPWTALGSRETRTEFWVNDPASIGSTSPPAR
jgi:hypothetical protein